MEPSVSSIIIVEEAAEVSFATGVAAAGQGTSTAEEASFAVEAVSVGEPGLALQSRGDQQLWAGAELVAVSGRKS